MFPPRPYLVLLTTLIALSSPTAADDPHSKQRLELMEQEVQQFDVTSSTISAAGALQFAARPLLRYSDPTRGLTEANVLIDASVWRLGDEGRPTALMTLEIYRADAVQGILSYEFLSLSSRKFQMRHGSAPHIVWEATESALAFKPLSDAPPPAATVPARLLQMRLLSKRFAVREKLSSGEEVVCRLLSQPIDRYRAPAEDLVDGALFAFANGTNPEMGVLLECSATTWTYALARLSAAETTVLLDDRQVARFPLVDSSLQRAGSYVSNSRPVKLPQ
jgi:hypothetical protein